MVRAPSHQRGGVVGPGERDVTPSRLLRPGVSRLDSAEDVLKIEDISKLGGRERGEEGRARRG